MCPALSQSLLWLMNKWVCALVMLTDLACVYVCGGVCFEYLKHQRVSGFCDSNTRSCLIY